MSGPVTQSPKEKDREDSIKLMLAANCHRGSASVSFGMIPYVAVRGRGGNNIINVAKTWEKVKFAAQIICGVPNAKDVLAISAKPFGQRAVHKFAQHIGASSISQRFTPGVFTNYSIAGRFQEPRVIVVCDPNDDHQAVHEAAYAGIPCIAICDTDAKIEFVDCVIPANTKNKTSIGLILWLLAREVLRLKGVIQGEWSVLPDLFFFQDADDEKHIREVLERQEEAGQAYTQEVVAEAAVPQPAYGAEWAAGADAWAA